MAIIDRLVYLIGYETETASFNRARQGLESLQSTVRLITGAVTAGSAALFGLAKSYANAGDSAAKFADRIGIDVERLQELQHVAGEFAGVEVRQLNTGLQRMVRRISEAAAGTGEAKQVLADMGFDAQELNRLKPEEQFKRIADAIKKIPLSGDQVRSVVKIFDMEGAGLVNLLREGGGGIQALMDQAADLGFVISEEQARQAENFNDELDRASRVVSGLRNIIGAQLLPALTSTITGVREWLTENRALVAQNLSTFFSGISTAIKTVWTALKFVLDTIQPVIDRFGGWGNVARFIITMAMTRALLTILVAIRAITASVGFLAGGLGRILGGLVLAGIALLLEDIFTWIEGGNSITGKWLGTWEKFKPKVDAVAASIQTAFKWLIDSVSIAIGWIVQLGEVLISSLDKGFRLLLQPAFIFFDLIKNGFTSMFEFVGKAPAMFSNMVGSIMSLLPDWLTGESLKVKIDTALPDGLDAGTITAKVDALSTVVSPALKAVPAANQAIGQAQLPNNIIDIGRRSVAGLSTVNNSTQTQANTNNVTQDIKIDVSGASDPRQTAIEVEAALRKREISAMRELQPAVR